MSYSRIISLNKNKLDTPLYREFSLPDENDSPNNDYKKYNVIVTIKYDIPDRENDSIQTYSDRCRNSLKLTWKCLGFEAKDDEVAWINGSIRCNLSRSNIENLVQSSRVLRIEKPRTINIEREKSLDYD